MVTEEDVHRWLHRDVEIEARLPYGYRRRLDELFPKTKFTKMEEEEYREAKAYLDTIKDISERLERGELTVAPDEKYAEYYGGIIIPEDATPEEVISHIEEGSNVITLQSLKRLVDLAKEKEEVVNRLELIDRPEIRDIIEGLKGEVTSFLEEVLMKYGAEKQRASKLEDAVKKCQAELTQCIVTCKKGDVREWMERAIKCEGELEALKAGGVQVLSPEKTVRKCVSRLKKIRRYTPDAVRLCGEIGKAEVRGYEQEMMKRIDDIVSQYIKDIS